MSLLRVFSLSPNYVREHFLFIVLHFKRMLLEFYYSNSNKIKTFENFRELEQTKKLIRQLISILCLIRILP